MLEREIIMADLEKKQMELVRFFGTDLKEVEAIFHGQRDKPVVGKNLPPCSGAVKWVRALHERVKDPMEKLTSLNKLVMETDESREVTELFERVGAQFEEYETEVLASWAKEVDATGEEKLKLNLLAYDEQAEIPGILRVNFDPKLVKLLRETKYFMLLDANVPASARKIYERNETLRQQTGNLDLIVGTFNNILRTLLPVERPLVAEKDRKDRGDVTKGHHHAQLELAQDQRLPRRGDDRGEGAGHHLNYLKNSVEKTQNVLRQWEENLMIDRKDGKTYAVDEFSEMQQKLQAERDEKIADGGVEITKFLQMSNKKVAVPRASKAWREYVEYVNEIVMEGYANAILASLKYLNEQVNSGNPRRDGTGAFTGSQPRARGAGRPVVTRDWRKRRSGSTGRPRLDQRMGPRFPKHRNPGPTVRHRRGQLHEGTGGRLLHPRRRVRAPGCDSGERSGMRRVQGEYDRYRYLWRNDLNGTLAEFRGTRTDPTATTPSSTSSTPRSQSTKRCKRRSRT